MSDATVPKCKSWLGHKFEARYSKGEPRELSYNDNVLALSSGNPTEFVDRFRLSTYERDICVRCGWTVPKVPKAAS